LIDRNTSFIRLFVRLAIFLKKGKEFTCSVNGL